MRVLQGISRRFACVLPSGIAALVSSLPAGQSPRVVLEPMHPSVVHRAFAITVDAMTSPCWVSSCSTVTTMVSRRQSGQRSLRVTKLLGTKRTVGDHSEHLADHSPPDGEGCVDGGARRRSPGTCAEGEQSLGPRWSRWTVRAAGLNRPGQTHADAPRSSPGRGSRRC